MKKKTKFSIKPNWYVIKITVLLGLISILNYFFTLEPHVPPEYNYFLRPIRVIFDAVVPYSWMNSHALLSFIIVSILTILYWYLLSCLIIFIYRLIRRRFPKGIKKIEKVCSKYRLLIFILIILLLVLYVRFCQKGVQKPILCIFEPQIECTDYFISASNNESDLLSFIFRNQMDETADFSFNATYFEKIHVTCTNISNLREGAKATINCVFENNILPKIGKKAKFEITGTYRTKDTNTRNTIKGVIYGSVMD